MPNNLNTATQYFTQSLDNFTTTLSSPAAFGATTIEVNSFSNGTASYANGALICLVLDPGTNIQNTVVGVVAFTTLTLTNVIWTEGGNNTHASGATVADYVTATNWDLLYKGITTQHTQSGTHTGVTTDTLSASGMISANGGLTLASGQQLVLPSGSIPTANFMSKTTDANGWIVYNYGAWTKYVFKSLSFPTATTLAPYQVSGVLGEISQKPLPVGIANMGQISEMIVSHGSANDSPFLILGNESGTDAYSSSNTTLPNFYVMNADSNSIGIYLFRITVELTT